MAKILLVDDDDDLRRIVRGMLEVEGYEILEASDCSSALRLLGVQHVDLVLLDIHLGDGSGLRVLESIKTNRPATVVIMMTGTVGLGNALKSIKLGAHDYITKPFSTHYLLKAIEHGLFRKDTEEDLQRS